MSVWASWSCGKDGAFAVHETRRAGDDVVGLLTTTSDGAVAMSRVPPELLARQAEALGLPCETVELPWPCPNEVYEQRTADGLELAGRAWDADLLAALPPGVDPCGENGEFHTFVTDGPGFAAPVDVVVGPPVARDGFVFSPLAAVGK